MTRQAKAFRFASATNEAQEQMRFRNNSVVKLENNFF